MVQINFALKEVNCKIVYYGPGMSGKTTNLEIVHQKAPEENKGDLTSISTDGDRTLFFDFMPLDLGNIAGMRTKFQLYTVPGQVYYNSTRKLVLQGVDGVIFVADSDPEKMEENLESYANLEENLKEYGKDLADLPHVIQWNKRDLPNALPVEELEKKINKFGVPTFEAVAVTGEGVFPTLKVLASMVLETINKIDKGAPKPRQAMPVKQAAPAAPKEAHTAQSRRAGAPSRAAAHQARQAPASGKGRGTAGRGRTQAQRPAAARQAGTRGQGAKKPAGAPARGRTRAPQHQAARAPRREEAVAAAGKSSSGLFVALLLFLVLAAAGAGYVLFFMNNK